MVRSSVRVEEPPTSPEAAEILREAAARSLSVRFRGGGTKFDWGNATPEPDLIVSTHGLNRIVEHNAADLTAVLEAGVRLADAQAAFAESGQMLAIDPPLGPDDEATIGGIVASGDSGPLRHRYGAARDLLVGMTVVLSDGTIAKSGGRVIKNVAGYDLAKLFTGSFGTLGMIVQVAVRLHPKPREQMTVIGSTDDPDALGRAAAALAPAPLEFESLDADWDQSSGRILARCAGTATRPRIEAASRLLPEAMAGSRYTSSIERDEDDELIWSSVRSRSLVGADGVLVKVSGLPSEVPRLIRTVTRLRGHLVARAGLGLAWVWLPPTNDGATIAAIEELRRDLAPYPCVVLEAPPGVREGIDVWGPPDGSIELMRRIKERFDPAGICNPGVFVV
ncbi:MAG TPA: FAD-binding oxidoreductase [Actinomycetota bacterium]|nr:FAD-binding oxidoreductase [Actinomycetota bacterium]